MISKELLSEVFGCDISDSIDKAGITRIIGVEDADDGTFLTFGYQSYEASRKRYINIYELAHKCKEWAFKTHNKIISSEVSTDDWVSVVAHFYGNLQVHIEESFSGATEPEAIFKACQWILDNKYKQ